MKLRLFFLLCLCCLGTLLVNTVHGKIKSSETKKPISVLKGLAAPVGMAFDNSSNIYISNWSADTIVRVTQNGDSSKIASGISSPSGVAISKDNYLYVASYSQGTIYRASLNNIKSEKTVKLKLFCKGFSVPAGINFDSNGNLLVADRGRGEIILVAPNKQKKKLIGNLKTPVGVVELDKNNIIISTFYGNISVYNPSTKSLRVISEKLRSPAVGVAIDPTKANCILAVDYGASDLYRIYLNGDYEVICSSMPQPVALSVSPSKLAYIATWGDNRLYKTRL